MHSYSLRSDGYVEPRQERAVSNVSTDSPRMCIQLKRQGRKGSFFTATVFIALAIADHDTGQEPQVNSKYIVTQETFFAEPDHTAHGIPSLVNA